MLANDAGRAMSLARILNAILLCIIPLQLLATYNVIDAASYMQEAWRKLDVSVDRAVIRTVISSNFLGPVLTIVPQDCPTVSSIDELVRKARRQGVIALSDSCSDRLDLPWSKRPSRRRLDLESLPMEILQPSPGGFIGAFLPRGVNRTISMTSCGRTFQWLKPSYIDRYFAFIATELAIIGEVDTMTFEDLVEDRKSQFHRIATMTVAYLFIKYIFRIRSIIRVLVGEQTENIIHWCMASTPRTPFDQALESIVLNSSLSVFIATCQISLCTVFFFCWKDGHFIVNKIPLFGFGLFAVKVFVEVLANELDKIFNYSQTFSTRRAVLIWSGWIFITLLLTLPMFGVAVTSLQYMWIIFSCGLDSETAGILSGRDPHAASTLLPDEDFANSCDRAMNSCLWVIVAIVLEQVIELAALVELSKPDGTFQVPQPPIPIYLKLETEDEED